MFDAYQDGSTSTFKEHVELPKEQARLLDWTTGLSGETGEVSELIKHHVFGGQAIDKYEMAKELGDILWYTTAMATTLGIRMQDVADLNLNKLQHRYNNSKFTVEGSQKRHSTELAFKDTPIGRIMEAKIMGKKAPMNVILIGPDGSGKTTLAKVLAEQLGFTYVKCNNQQEDKPALALEKIKTDINVVYDRFYYPDDIIYNRIKKIPTVPEYEKGYDAVLAQMEKSNTFFIFVTADLETLCERSKVWIDDYVSVEDLPFIIEYYDKFLMQMFSRNIHCACIDTSNITPEEAVNSAFEMVTELQFKLSHISEIKEEM